MGPAAAAEKGRRGLESRAGVEAQRKKNLTWHTLFGVIEVVEEIFTRGRKGGEVRPFSQSAEVHCRGYSQPMQRAITDFGADGAFAQIPQKMKEHYGIEVPVSTARQITEQHGKAVLESQRLRMPARSGVACVIAQMDGSMIPIVETPEPTEGSEAADRRKSRQLS